MVDPSLIKFPCPKCGRTLIQSGDLTVDASVLPVFQCDECLVTAEVMGEPMELALTFAIGADGHAFDPASGERLRFDSSK